MKSFFSACFIAGTLFAIPATQLSPAAAFKLGTFAQGDRTFLGLVLDDSAVIDLSKADASLPTDMTSPSVSATTSTTPSAPPLCRP